MRETIWVTRVDISGRSPTHDRLFITSFRAIRQDMEVYYLIPSDAPIHGSSLTHSYRYSRKHLTQAISQSGICLQSWRMCFFASSIYLMTPGTTYVLGIGMIPGGKDSQAEVFIQLETI
jgi:hypothetical protein